MRHTFRSAARSTAALKSAALAALGLGTLALTPTAARSQTQDLFASRYDSNANTFSISRFAGTGPGTFSTTATTLSAPSLSTPAGLAFDARGDLFTANAAGSTITEFPAGATPGTFGAGTVFASGLSFPNPLVIDSRATSLSGTGAPARSRSSRSTPSPAPSGREPPSPAA